MAYPEPFPEPFEYPDTTLFPDHNERIKYIEDRYGEDIADAIWYGVHLYFQPDAPETDDPDSWSLSGFQLAARDMEWKP